MNSAARPDHSRNSARALASALRAVGAAAGAPARALLAFDPLKHLSSIVRLVNRLGVGWTTVLFAIFSAIMSVSLVFGAGLFFDMPNWRTHLTLSLLIPLIVSSPFSFLICSALRDLDKARLNAIALSRSDVLTGIANRRAFFETANRARRRGMEAGLSRAVLFADIDHFKAINDRYGHEAGDAVLRNFADSLKACTRADDLIARMGGEEFVVYVAGADPAGLAAIANGLLARVRESEIDYCGKHFRYSISLGGALGPAAMTVDRLLALADAQLYQVKRSGRDAYAFTDARDAALPVDVGRSAA
jgi:diguanylate cyclase (GGDEF)-like protein